jgi:hypothetical protein
MKKILILGLVLALVAILVAPMAAFATGPTEVTGSVTTTSVSVTPPDGFGFGNFAEGLNGPPAGSTQGDVEFTQGTATEAWQLQVYSKNDGTYDFSAGKMYCTALPRYLDTPLSISVDGSNYYDASPGVPIISGGTTASFLYWLYAKQTITHADAIAGAGSYFILIYSEVTLTP